MHRTIDLFAGCGGLSEGFLQAGSFEMVAHVEWENAPCEALKRRLKTKWGEQDENRVIQFDIQRTEELLGGWTGDTEYGTHPGLLELVADNPIDLVIGGPPCQAYSLAGRIRDENGMQDDYRNYLFESFVRLLDALQPRAFIFENVLGMLSASPGGIPITDRIRAAFEESGYITIENYSDAVFNLADHGVPQNRKRVIILGLKEGRFENPNELIHQFYRKEADALIPTSERPMTVREAIGDLPSLMPQANQLQSNGRKYSHSPIETGIDGHSPRFHNQRDIETFRILTEDLESGRREYTSTESIRQLYTERTGKSANVHKYHVIRPDQPGNTIPAHLYKDGLRHIHWDSSQARTITVREAACIQGFPRDFLFPTATGAAYKMIGNAVPPTFARLLANGLAILLSEFGTSD